MLLIGVGGLIATQRAGEAEALVDVRTRTQLTAKAVVEPLLGPGILDGDEASLARLDAEVTAGVLDDATVRVKLWAADGRIIYSDEPALIGERYELHDEQKAALTSGRVVVEISSLEEPENRFENDHEQLLEVYLPLEGPDGVPVLYESYFDVSQISESSSRIRAAVAPIVIGSLLIIEVTHLLLAWMMARRLQRGVKERERLLQRAIEASELERRRIAADLHDGVVQELVGTSLTISAAAETASQSSAELGEDLRSAAAGTRRSLQSLRSLLVDIYPPNLDALGLEAALVDLLAPAIDLGMITDVSITGTVDESAATTAMIYRFIQEAVRNVIRHAEATSITVSVDSDRHAITASVTDDGKGFRPTESADNGHFGLRLLSDLAGDLGASLIIDSRPGGGTTIHLEVPHDSRVAG